MIESENKFETTVSDEILYRTDGKKVNLESLKGGFFKLMADKHKMLELPDSERRIKFLIGVYLVDNKLFSRTALNSEKALNIINKIFGFFVSSQKAEKEIIKPIFSKEQTESMIQQARKQQLGEKSRAKLTEEGERDIFGQTIGEFDKSRER
jgi:hypothetical protein